MALSPFAFAAPRHARLLMNPAKNFVYQPG
jgi:hypothetical protein